jgi:hypothetical protein
MNLFSRGTLAFMFGLAVLSSVLQCGCSNLAGRPRPWIELDAVERRLNASTVVKAAEPGTPGAAAASSNEPKSNAPLEIVAAYMAADETSDPGKKELRNRYLVSSMLLIDAEYDRFVIRQGAVRKGGDTFAQTTAATLAAASAAFSPEVTKTALSLIAASVIAANTAINKNYFYEQTFPMLLKQMEADRTEALLSILRNHVKTDAEYPLIAAHRDLRALYGAGTFENAFARLDQAASRNKEQADEASKNYVTASPSLSIQRWLSDPKLTKETRAERTKVLEEAINAVDEKGLNETKSALVWLFKASDNQLNAVAAIVRAPSVSEAEVVAQEAKSSAMVETMERKQSIAREKINELLMEGKLDEARALLVARIQVLALGRRGELSDPIVNAAGYAGLDRGVVRTGGDVSGLVAWVQDQSRTVEQLAKIAEKLIPFE